MKKSVRILSAALALVMLIAVAPAAFAAAGYDNFKNVREYKDGQFQDVKSDQWFCADVEKAYELGLVQGVDDNEFGAYSNITLAEAITLAARIHSIYNTGAENFVQGDIWYRVYVDYALENRIIAGEYDNYNRAATRAEFAVIIREALPWSAYTAINTVEDDAIPDVLTADPYGQAVYVLYRAGVLTGNDDKGTFTPGANIQRNAMAAIVARVAVPALRQQFSLSGSTGSIETNADLNAIKSDLDKAVEYAESAKISYDSIKDLAAIGLPVSNYYNKVVENNVLSAKYSRNALNGCDGFDELNAFADKLERARAYNVQAAQAFGANYQAQKHTEILLYLSAALKNLEEAQELLKDFK